MRRKEKTMKKLLIFILVLGLASAANAAIVTFDASGEADCAHAFPTPSVDVLAGAVVTVEITADTAVGTYAVSITETTTSSAGHSTATAVGTYHSNFNLNVVAGRLQNTMTGSVGGTPRYMLIDRATAGISPANPVAAGQVLYSFDVLIPAGAEVSDTFVITAAVGKPVVTPPANPGYGHLLDAVPVATTNALTIHVVPEPMTILLLGLGGLLLRRRK
jgi:hypothetical protein